MNLKNKYMLVALVLVPILVMLIVLTLFLERRNNYQTIQLTPTSTSVIPTSSQTVTEVPLPVSGKLSPVTNFTYPIKFEGLVIEYVKSSNTLIVYYQQDKEKAKAAVSYFFKQYGNGNEDDILVRYIGSARDPEEPEQGSYSR